MSAYLRLVTAWGIVALLALAIAGMCAGGVGVESPASSVPEVMAPEAIVPDVQMADLLSDEDGREVRDEVGGGASGASDAEVGTVRSSAVPTSGPASTATYLETSRLEGAASDVATNEPTPPAAASGVSLSRDEVLSGADVLAVLPSTSWPAEAWERLPSIVACESGGEVGQRRGDAGLAWGLLSVRVDVHPHLLPLLEERTAWGDLEAGWHVYVAREALGWSGWDAWYVCSRRGS